MTNTKFRKRALLSSVAMLLVALVALGSATFAWFVANPSVSAGTLEMKTSADPGLAIASTSAKALYQTAADAFDNTTKFAIASGTKGNWTVVSDYTDFNLQPVSIDLSTGSQPSTITPTLAYIEAASNTGYEKKASTAFSTDGAMWTYTDSTHSGRAYYEDLFIKTTTTGTNDAAPVKSVNVNISAANTDVAKGLRVCLIGHWDSTVEYIGTWAAASASPNGCYDSDVAQAVTTCSFETNNTRKNLPTQTITVSSDPDDNFIRVIVYLDGQDSNVKSSNVSNLMDIMSNLEITVYNTATA